MTSIDEIKSKMRIPVIGAPMFIVSTPKLVIAQCQAGVIGSFPALNARPEEKLDEWLTEIKETLARHDEEQPNLPSAPYAVNQIVHRTNNRLMHDVEACVKHEVPIVITSLGAREEVYEAIHSYGGIVLHDVINNSFAKKAIEKGADGLICVAAGAGGHAGVQSPFALVQEIREWFDGPLALSGCITRGQSVLAAEAMGADFGYVGTGFIATEEANADQAYKDGIVEAYADDIVYTNYFSGVHGNYIKSSIRNSGMDPDNLPESDPTKMDFKSGGDNAKKVWKDIWGGGQGVGAIKEVSSTAAFVDKMAREYETAKADLCNR
ncbi:nitronate monooxygenase family protein [Hyphococcus formosus]|uniref:NAD(P)H-dependent flavin oxidoreductase n=1 Tax=Hyphococcus formosus TaxID=3143534 RepID=UPI00398B8E7D